MLRFCDHIGSNSSKIISVLKSDVSIGPTSIRIVTWNPYLAVVLNTTLNYYTMHQHVWSSEVLLYWSLATP